MPNSIMQSELDDKTDEFEVTVPSPPELMKRRAKSHVGFILGSTVVMLALFIAIFSSLLAPFDPYDQDLTRRLIQPVWHQTGTWEHPFGTDALGRDYLSRLMFGSQVSLMIGFFAAAISAVVGSPLG
jgi:peptide/nickel transport system permease protein